MRLQKSVNGFDFQPKALRTQATSRHRPVNLKEATARRDAIEKRVAALQTDAQKFVTANVETATDTYDELAKRGETVVKKFRSKPPPGDRGQRQTTRPGEDQDRGQEVDRPRRLGQEGTGEED